MDVITVQRICRRYTTTGNKNRIPRSDRRRNSTAREDRRLYIISRLSRFVTARALTDQSIGYVRFPVSKFTTKRRLKSAGIFSRVTRRKPLIFVHIQQTGHCGFVYKKCGDPPNIQPNASTNKMSYIVHISRGANAVEFQCC